MSFEASLNKIENTDNTFEKQVEVLEDSFLDSGKKLDMALLLILEEKRACQVGSFKILEGENKHVAEETIQEFTKDFEETRRILDDMELPYFVKQKPGDDDDFFGFSILTAKNEGDLKEVVEADKNGDDKKFGIMMGYPQTSVDSFNTEGAFDWESELPLEQVQKLKEEGVTPFINFMPSKEGWENELELVRERMNIINSKFPKLYAEAVSENVGI